MDSKLEQVVAIGASAGGVQALQALLKRFSYDHAAFVIVTHLAPGWKSMLQDILQRHTVLEMKKVTESIPMLANYAYVMGEGIEITTEGDRIHCHERPLSGISRPIDRLFNSLAHSWRDRALGVVLSGMGSDGALGLRTMQEQGARTFVQEPTSAMFGSMPASARPFANFCLEPGALGDEIMRSLKAFRPASSP